jgi:hypothetical protein
MQLVLAASLSGTNEAWPKDVTFFILSAEMITEAENQAEPIRHQG